MEVVITKKKHFHMMQSVKDFMREQSGDVKKELNNIIWRLEIDGSLVMPYGEKNKWGKFICNPRYTSRKYKSILRLWN